MSEEKNRCSCGEFANEQGEHKNQTVHCHASRRESEQEKLKRANRIYNSDSGASDPQDSSMADIWGEEFKGVKGKEAVELLLKEKRGHVKGAFRREDMGEIDLVWGSDSLGLKHIIQQREREMIANNKSKAETERHLSELLSEISDAVENGSFKKQNSRGNFEFMYKRTYVVIAPTYHNNKVNYLLTAFKRK